MPQLFADVASYIGGLLCADGTGYLTLTMDDLTEQQVPNSHFIKWNGARLSGLGSVPWYSKGLAKLPDGDTHELLSVGEWGEYALIGNQPLVEDSIPMTSGLEIKKRGPIRRGGPLGGGIVLAGMDRQALYRTRDGQWESLDRMALASGNETAGFEAFAGLSKNELYFLGWKGEIWLYNGLDWRKIDSPVNAVFTNACCDDRGTVYACGRKGLLVRGRGDQWEVVSAGNSPYDFWGIAWFKGKLYLASLYRIYSFDGNNIEVISMKGDTPKTFSHLSSTEAILWSIGPKDVMAFDGNAWTRID